MLEKIKVFAIGPMTAESLESKGIMNIYVAEKHTIEGIIDLMKQVFSKKEDL
jgi:uroporphyrinogen-III synthase